MESSTQNDGRREKGVRQGQDKPRLIVDGSVESSATK